MKIKQAQQEKNYTEVVDVAYVSNAYEHTYTFHQQ